MYANVEKCSLHLSRVAGVETIFTKIYSVHFFITFSEVKNTLARYEKISSFLRFCMCV